MLTNQIHLNYADRVNLGGYYTPPDFIRIAWEMAAPHITPDTVVLDSACGYGNFLDYPLVCRRCGADLDQKAVRTARCNFPATAFLHSNALSDVCRQKYRIGDSERLVVIGNPPYNDRTSIIRQQIKSVSFPIDRDISTRDLGCSFLLSYNKLRADYVCVLHPLSYLIKRSNFRLLRAFAENYRLRDGIIISSAVFADSSKAMSFPILIGLYQRSPAGMTYDDIRRFGFRVFEGETFRVDDFDYIPNYVRKYPERFTPKTDSNSLFFWTLRDINALKRNRTFVRQHSSNTIVVDRQKLDYYIYIDVFKRFAHTVPYYFGNSDIMIDDDLFCRHKKYFVADAIARHPFLAKHFLPDGLPAANRSERKITGYFGALLGGHYAH